MTVIPIDRDELMNLLTRGRIRPGEFSCNIYRQVWCDTKLGYHYERDRDYLKSDEFPTLHEIVDLALSVRPEGGKFYVRRGGAFWANGQGAPICEFHIVG